jgi:hypothetical protein
MLSELWLTAAEIMNLPDTGAAWDNVVAYAQIDTAPDLSDGYDNSDVATLAKALVYARTGDESYRDEVIERVMDAIGTEGGGSSAVLYLGRGLISYVLAADLVQLPAGEDAIWREYLDQIRTADIGSSRTLVECHEERPNNWGTHCGASRLAASLYLGDADDIQRCDDVFAGWLGDRSRYAGFDYGDLCWQSDPDAPVGINPAGDVWDGVLPDDQRRGGCPPATPCENYVREALQGVLVQSLLLDAWSASDTAILRAFNWLQSVGCDWPGDDEWEPWVVNWAYGSSFPTTDAAQPGKGFGFTDWVYGSPCDVIDIEDLVDYLENWGGTTGLLDLLAAWGMCL